jgi:acyl transferase domain-containing protein/NAD(P)H-dependent flavin oxidoreductase YrpB (nitropropane dioxygenase family)/NAD(P)-dependent dehydrogenase (short-subunit alcohol dehydrogenase family)
LSWRQFVFSPEGFDQVALLSAAARAQCTAVLSLGAMASEEATTRIATLARNDGGEGFGVSIPSLGDEALRALFASQGGRALTTIVLAGNEAESLADSIAWCKAHGIEALVEITTLDEATRAGECGADGLIAKGSESGGRVAEETTFVLLQRILPAVNIPVYARGGIGLYTASACLAAGAAGIALDWQLALSEESTLPEAVKLRVSRMDGSETAILGQDSKLRFRAYSRVGETAYFELKRFEEAHGVDRTASEETLSGWKRQVEAAVRGGQLLLIGQDAALAKDLADEFRTVKGICRAIRAEASRQVRVASRLNHLGESAPLAKSQDTRFPVLQGPMTRVSDNADFAAAVARGGAVPYIALALMRGEDVARLLEETRNKLEGRPWGVGILGFVPKELRDEQLEQVKKFKPTFMIIAGGRPDMAKQLESEGIQAYLHVPSPVLARNFLETGARRLIFEGRECGGHVGPRTSFVLWEQMTRVLLDHLRASGSRAEDYHIIFAGGLHDSRSGAMLSAITAPLAERGVRVGGVIGTGYLFTREIVSTGAITATFQEQALACHETVLVESGVGHATRCADSEFATAFADLKRRLHREGKPKEEIREELESLNLGRLRIASKGVIRTTGEDGRAVYLQSDPETVRREGMFMIGQVAALRREVCTVEELHRDFCSSGELLRQRADALIAECRQGRHGAASDIAIVGLSCVFPESDDVREYWQNILNRRYAIREIPKERFDVDVYFNADRRARDKVYSRWGGFINDVVIDPMKFGMPPSSLPSIDPLQLVTLEMIHRALRDAGYDERRFDRENTCCVVGTGGGVGELGLAYGIRSMLPYHVDQAGGTLADSAELIGRMAKDLPEWTEDSFAGLLLNVVAGRVANRFDFGGTNFIVDAACATSLAALRNGVTELETGSSDVAVVAAADMMQSAFTYLCFSKTQALSPTGQPRVFDETGDGIVISEGVACAVLKRLDDALLDGDKIYGVIKSVGASSDGKDKGLTAPRAIGQMRALDRAYKKAGVDPKTVGLLEAHGTGTAVGDRTEAEALANFFSGKGADRRAIALGSVKSMIGHSKCAAGFAGLIKATMAMRHSILPSTLGVTKPNAKAGSEESPLYVNSETRPWLQRLDGAPRRAGISAFGFGGTNFHVVAEEFHGMDGSEPEEASFRNWPSELILFRNNSAQNLLQDVKFVLAALRHGTRPALVDVASAIYWEYGRNQAACCLAAVADSVEDLIAKLDSAISAIESGKEYRDPKGVYFSPNAASSLGKIAFTFPGQGSQSVGMMNDLAIAFPEVRRTFEEADRSLGLQLGKPLSGFIFPPPTFSDADRQANESALKQTNVAQPALGAADLAMFRLLKNLGIAPDVACGHSYGEFAALCAAGAFTVSELIRISELRGRAIIQSAQNELGTMAAVEGGEAQVSRLIRDIAEVVVANVNGPAQTVISGTKKGIEEAVERLKGHGLKARSIPVACAFHSPLVSAAKEPLHRGLSDCDLKPPRFPVYSNTTAGAHSDDVSVTTQLLVDHLTRPVRFVDEIQAMYAAGSRIFVECGPGRVLTGLVSSCLAGKPHVAIQMDQPGRSSLVQLVHALAQMAVAGVPLHAMRLFEGRVAKKFSLDDLARETQPKSLPAAAWIVTNGRAVPVSKFRDPSWTVLPAHPEIRNSNTHVLVKSVQDDAFQQSVAPPGGTPETAGRSIPQVTYIASEEARPLAAPAITLPPMAERPINQPALPVASPDLMQGHHRLMGKFLETHRAIMLASLRIQPAALPGTTAHVGSTTNVVGPAQFVSPKPEPVQVAAAAAGAESAFTSLALPAAKPEPARTVAPSPAAEEVPASIAPGRQRVGREQIARILLELVSQRTGYPVESLDVNLDLEADLGVDSIKRVEIFSALQSDSLLPNDAIEGQIESLSRLKTLQAIVDWIDARIGQTAGYGIGSGTSVGAPPSPRPAMTRDDITGIVLQLVSQRTGYPVESLDINLDLEADLGVDSIKRVEIFSAMQSESALPASAIEGQIETLSRLKTLGEIVEWIEGRCAEPTTAAPAAEGPLPGAGAVADVAPAPTPAAAAESVAPVTRLKVQVVDAPAAEGSVPFSGFALITNDGEGVADAFSARLNGLGIRNCVIDHAPNAGTDLQDAGGVATLIGSLREKYGPIGGLVHLMPLASAGREPVEIENRALLDLRSLYLLAKGLEKDLRSGGVLISATRLGGAFGFGPAEPDGFVVSNGVIPGFVKTAGREWPETECRVIDFAEAHDARAIARLLADELQQRDGLLEVGYAGGSRRILRPMEAALDDSHAAALKLDHDSVILMTGGARGITAATALELARTFHPRLILVGRSPMPVEESADIVGISDPRQLRAALMDRLQTGGQRPTPALIEGMARRVIIDREIRSNIAMLRGLASAVEYHSVDVSDPVSMGNLLESIYSRYGRIDGVVHGAGLIEDKLIGDKSPESFDRVIRPKVSGAIALARALRPEGLQFLAFFSSVSARYGNRGQCDYAAANEFLNKFAVELNRKWPGRVLSFNWGPWKTDLGMVSDQLAARFKDAGIQLIEVPAGREAFLKELLHGQKADAEVLFGGPLTTSPGPPKTSKPVAFNRFPLIDTLTRSNGTIIVNIDSHPEQHVFLQDHQIDGKPVLPMMAALEILAETAAATRPGEPFTSIRNLRNLNGVTYGDGAGRKLRVDAPASNSGSGELDLLLKGASTGKPHYRSRIEFAGVLPPPPPRIRLINRKAFPLSVPDAYERWLFHGPLLAGISEIIGMGDNGIIGRIQTVDINSLIRSHAGGQWLVDPVITDSSLQLVLLWARATYDQTPLPSALDAYYNHRPLHSAREVLCEIEIVRLPGTPTLRSRHVFYDQDDCLLGWMEGMESTMSKSLNRICGKSVGEGVNEQVSI